jgi:crotonobetaine/carnitine-CoA ligase
MYLFQNIRIAFLFIRSLVRFSRDELGRGTFIKNLKSMISTKEILEDMSWAELLEEKASKHPERTFLVFEDERFTYKEMNRNANRFANFLVSLGGRRGRGIR